MLFFVSEECWNSSLWRYIISTSHLLLPSSPILHPPPPPFVSSCLLLLLLLLLFLLLLPFLVEAILSSHDIVCSITTTISLWSVELIYHWEFTTYFLMMVFSSSVLSHVIIATLGWFLIGILLAYVYIFYSILSF